MVKNEDVQLVQPKKDHEIEMAKSQTKSVALNSVQILNTLKSGQYDELPAWVQSKLTLSKHNLQSVYDYMLGKYENTTSESTEKYKKSLEKIANDKQLKMLSKKDKETLMKIAKLMKKNERKEELTRLTNMLEAKMRPNVQKLLKQKGYGPIFGAIDSSKQNLKQMKYSRGEIEDTLISMFGDEDQKILQKIKESVNEKKGDFLNSLFPKSKVQKAIDIAKKMGGNMTGAVKKIEKFFPGMTLNTDVQDALRLANESVNEQQKRQASDIQKKYDKAHLKFSREVRDIIQMINKYQGDRTDGKIIDKAYSKHLIPFNQLIQSWTDGQHRNPNLSEMDSPMFKITYKDSAGRKKDDIMRAKNPKLAKRDFDALHKGRGFKILKVVKESMNEDVYAIVDKFDDKKQDYDQVYFKDNDLNKVKKHMKKMGSKYGKMNLIKVKSNGKMSLVERMDKRQAGVMLKQLGGNKFIMMTGAKNFAVGPKGAGFKIGRNSKNVNFVRIDLKNDLYDMEFFQVRAGKMKLKSKVKQIYADQLQDQFTKHTGMYTSL